MSKDSFTEEDAQLVLGLLDSSTDQLIIGMAQVLGVSPEEMEQDQDTVVRVCLLAGAVSLATSMALLGSLLARGQLAANDLDGFKKELTEDIVAGIVAMSPGVMAFCQHQRKKAEDDATRLKVKEDDF